MFRGIMRYITILCALLLLCSIGGVFATWHYTTNIINHQSASLDATLVEFVYKPEDILPTESELGENHLMLIELILNEREKGYGLNYDNKHVLEKYLESNGIIFSNQKTSGGNLKFVSDETRQLYYCVEKISDTLYYAYTFAYNDLNAAKGTSATIPVYRTFLEKTDIWRATKTYFGYTHVVPLRNFGASNLSGTLAYTIDVSTWIPHNHTAEAKIQQSQILI